MLVCPEAQLYILVFFFHHWYLVCISLTDLKVYLHFRTSLHRAIEAQNDAVLSILLQKAKYVDLFLPYAAEPPRASSACYAWKLHVLPVIN